MRALVSGAAFVARRLLQALLVMLAILVIAFAVRQSLGDPLREIMGQAVPESERAELRHQLGLDAPWPVQLGRYLGRAASGDLGTSIVTRQPVLKEFLTLFPATLGYLGRRIDRLRLPLRLPLGRRRGAAVSADGHLVPAVGWVRGSGFVQRHSGLAVVGSIAVLVRMATPFLGVRFAGVDASVLPTSFSAGAVDEAIARDFAEPLASPVRVAVYAPPSAQAGVSAYAQQLGAVEGVAGVGEVVANIMADFELTMALSGCRTVTDITADHLVAAPA